MRCLSVLQKCVERCLALWAIVVAPKVKEALKDFLHNHWSPFQVRERDRSFEENCDDVKELI